MKNEKQKLIDTGLVKDEKALDSAFSLGICLLLGAALIVAAVIIEKL